jgi:hypothetical protein
MAYVQVYLMSWMYTSILYLRIRYRYKDREVYYTHIQVLDAYVRSRRIMYINQTWMFPLLIYLGYTEITGCLIICI